MPLIDMPPADPTAIKTAIHQARKVSICHGQEFVVFTCDQQLYRVSSQVLWMIQFYINVYFHVWVGCTF